jgi:hypothetical protein
VSQTFTCIIFQSSILPNMKEALCGFSRLVSPKFERKDEPTQEEIEMLLNEVPD